MHAKSIAPSFPTVDPQLYVPCGCAKRYSVIVGPDEPPEVRQAWHTAQLQTGALGIYLDDPDRHRTIQARVKVLGRGALVSGLVPGGALPTRVVEAWACGARPVLFDHTGWELARIGPRALYINPDEPLVDQLRAILAKPIPKVTATERAWVIEHFGVCRA